MSAVLCTYCCIDEATNTVLYVWMDIYGNIYGKYMVQPALLSLGRLYVYYVLHARKVKPHEFSVVLHKNYYSVRIGSGFNYLLLN